MADEDDDQIELRKLIDACPGRTVNLRNSGTPLPQHSSTWVLVPVFLRYGTTLAMYAVSFVPAICCDRCVASQGTTNIRRQLQKECSRALQYYMRALQQSCDLLAEIKGPVIAPATRNRIFSHHKEELSAYTAFTAARRRLWRFLSDLEPAPARMTDMPPRKRPSNKRSDPGLDKIDQVLG
jgi:hypothetical protein